MRVAAFKFHRILFTLLAITLSQTPAANAGSFTVMAGPNFYGPWTEVAAHAGSITYSIDASPLGKTVVTGEVMYFGSDGQQRVEPFHRQVTIRTCNCYATVKVRFRGTPLGSAVNVTVLP